MTDEFRMFEWKPEYSVNIRSIDAQHQRLFAIGRELYRAMKEGKGNAAMAPILDRLVHYTVEHFTYEENLMRTNGYPGFANHKVLHDSLVKQVKAYQVEFKSGRSSLAVPLMQFVKDWLDHHIKKSDAAYAPFLQAKQVA